MLNLTEGERKGAFVILALLALGTGYDLVRARLPARALQPNAGDRARPATLKPEAPVGIATGAGPDRPRVGSQGSDSSTGDVRLDLNRATAAELDALPGIGPVLASRIVAQRQQHGLFRSVEELRMVRGIGPALMSRLRPRLEVRTPAGP